jgi:ubiquinone/menaquinone biosynthesis C-methylase UbiE
MVQVSDHKDQILEQFSQQAEGYAQLTRSLADDRQAAFRALIGAQATDNVLDVCCGPGTMALALAPYVANVTGLDLTPAMLEQARAAQAKTAVRNAEWLEGDVYALPFEDSTFTLVISSAAFHHMTDPKSAFRELARVCRPGGKIVIRDVTPSAQKSAAYDRMEILRDPSHVHALTPAELAALGDGLPVDPPELLPSVTAGLDLDAVLATSFPTACSIADIRATFLEDARSGQDQLGFDARLAGEKIQVSYPQTTALWIKR